MTCPICKAMEIPDDFPTASQGPTTRKYQCGSEYYGELLVYPCGYIHQTIDYSRYLGSPEAKKLIEKLKSL